MYVTCGISTIAKGIPPLTVAAAQYARGASSAVSGRQASARGSYASTVLKNLQCTSMTHSDGARACQPCSNLALAAVPSSI